MKNFVYFESQEGGMGVISATESCDLDGLYGWMREDCEKQDTALVEWMKIAEVGEMYDHRLGYLVRLKDEVEL